MKKFLLLAITHLSFGAVGFAAGIYALPILTAPPAPSVEEVHMLAKRAQYNANFRRSLEGSDMFHWGEGVVTVGSTAITLMGRLSPGPDYKLYLSPEFVKTKEDFMRVRPRMARVGDVRTFENFVVEVPQGIDPSSYNTVVVWCESFGQFITAGQYREAATTPE